MNEKIDLSVFGKWASTDDIKKHYVSEKMFICPSCKIGFSWGNFNGVCPKCNYEEKILFKWINPEYKLRKSK